jgi:hypothetical protein
MQAGHSTQIIIGGGKTSAKRRLSDMAPNIPPNQDLGRLASLVDHRTEEPDVEYKSWMDLGAAENKSKLAKHLCAIANYGGGWIIFGVANDGSHAEPHPSDLSGYSQDIINGIVSRYLQPAFHCNVHMVTSAISQKKYPVVQVPPHGAQPVCAKSDGPLVENRRVGVTRGIHYIRVPGPKSEPIDRPELWQKVLHRCVLLERDNLLASIGRLFVQPSIASDASSLDNFVDEAIARWDDLQKEGWLIDPKKNRTALGFQFFQSNGDPVPAIQLSSLREGIREASNAADTECPGQWTFDISHRGPIGPSVVLVAGTDGYEVAAIYSEDGSYLMAPSLWRALISGTGAEIRPYHEDTDWVRGAVEERSSRNWPIGARLSPRFQAVRIYQFVAVVRNLAQIFPEAVQVKLTADYNGLAGRTIEDAKAGIYYSIARKSSTDSRQIDIDATVESLLGPGAADAAALLLNPMLRLFDGHEVSADFVRKSVKELF